MTGSVVVAQQGEKMLVQTEKKRLFKPGERVRWTRSPFAGRECNFQMAHFERHAVKLIDLLSKKVWVIVGCTGELA